MPALPTTEIDPEGDVILVVGLQKIRLRVSSLFLKKASTKFAALFQKNAERMDLFKRAFPGDTVEVGLPKDNASAMHILCKILHLDNTGLPTKMESADMLGLGIAADRYDCASQLQFVTYKLFKHASKTAHTVGGTANLLAAAYLLRDPTYFTFFSRKLIYEQKASFTALFGGVAERHLPAGTFRTFAQAPEKPHTNVL